MKKFTLLVLLSSLVLTVNEALAQALVSWTTAPSSAWNATWPPTSTADNITVSSFTKGAGITGSGSPASGAWGGSGGWGNASSNTLNGSLYFTIKANTGYQLSLTSIPFFYSRRSNSGPTGATVLYSIDGGTTYTTLATVTTSSTSTAGTNNPINTLASHDSLQNIPSSTTVIFKIVPNTSSNNWYINSGGIQFNGSVVEAAPLPISLVSFTGASKGGNVMLNWLTASETNNSHFEIERSLNAKKFDYIANVASANSIVGASYSYTDKAADAVIYYRLKTVDMDGTYAYSPVIKIAANNASGKESNIVLKGNPVSDLLRFTSSFGEEATTYKIVNMSGVSLKQGTVTMQDNIADISVNDLPAGLYVLHLYSNNEGHSVIKFVKQ